MSELMSYSIVTLNRLSDSFLFDVVGELSHEYTSDTVDLANRVLTARGLK